MARPRPPRPEPVDPLDRELAEACAEAEEIEKRDFLALIRRANAEWWDEQRRQPCDPRF
ncbi:MAG: hypothetical protein ACK4Y4_11990 [Brevundimonas sp.]